MYILYCSHFLVNIFFMIHLEEINELINACTLQLFYMNCCNINIYVVHCFYFLCFFLSGYGITYLGSLFIDALFNLLSRRCSITSLIFLHHTR